MFKIMTSSIKPNAAIPTDDELKKVSSFMFCNWLSGNRSMLQLATVFNNYNAIPIKCQYLAVKYKYGGKINYVPYPKKSKVDSGKKIEVIMEMVDLSLEKAVDYLKYISKEEYKMLKTEYELRHTR